MKKDGTINVESILLHTYSPEKREEGKRKLDDILSTCKFQGTIEYRTDDFSQMLLKLFNVY